MKKNKGGSRLYTGKKSKKLKVFLIVLGSLAAVAAGVFIWYRFFFSVAPVIPFIDDDEEDGIFADVGGRAPAGITGADRKEGFFTVLIVGMDGGSNTDTIMVAAYDTVNKEAALVSIARDTLVNVERRVKKINSAYAHGRRDGGGHEGGVAQMQREVKSLIGFVPDFTVTVDLKAFEMMIDTVNGVEIDVPYVMRYHDPAQNLTIHFSPGVQKLNGADALKFSRYRMGSGGGRTITDFERMENQQTVIKALLKEILKPANLLKMNEFIGIFNDNVKTDLKTGNLVWFGEQLATLRGTDALTTHSLPMAGGSGLPNYYEYVDQDKTIELINQYFNPYVKPILPEHVDIITSAP
jgi:LCP family protein required for cell wall assembly